MTYTRWVGEGIGLIGRGSRELDAMARLEGSGGIGGQDWVARWGKGDSGELDVGQA